VFRPRPSQAWLRGKLGFSLPLRPRHEEARTPACSRHHGRAYRRPRGARAGPEGLDSSGPWSPKPARIYANPRARPRPGAPRRPHGYAVSGASTRPVRLPENRGVPSSIPGLATSRFYLLIAGFCAGSRAALRSCWGRLSAFRVQLSVLNGPHSGAEAPTPGDKARPRLARAPGRRARPPRATGGTVATAWWRDDLRLRRND
jgi:hypothetical protein